MVAGTQVLAIIPARAGSKSLPRKNIRDFGGHPLVAWSIAAGIQASTVQRVLVTTDDEEIAAVAKDYGAEVPFIRPNALALDDTLDLPVFEHALDWLANEDNYRPDLIVQLRPTSPIRPSDCVDGAVQTLIENPAADSVRGVVPSGQNPFKMWFVEGNRLRPLLDDPPEAYNMPRQRLPRAFWQTGHIDAIRRTTIVEQHSMSGSRILPWLVDPAFSVDIDTATDWTRAEQRLLDGTVQCVMPGSARRPLPSKVDLLILDFDGVLTDDRVWVSEGGEESVAANRADGYGISILKEQGVRIVVISREEVPTVAARCRKLDIEYSQGVLDKQAVVAALLSSSEVDPDRTIYVGNDVTDLPCFAQVACGIAVANAHPRVRAQADLVLTKKGGHGAVRELCDILSGD